LIAGSTPAEILDTLSIGGPIVLDEGNTLGADARGDNVSINLRGIGSGNTLVLLNGRRLPPHPISQAESGVPSLSSNVNQLPAAAMERMEILRDGASAIYGTDAAAGVVNSITRTKFDGLSLRARGMVTQHGGGNEWNFEVTDGRNFNQGKGNLLVTLDYFHRDTLGAWQRNFSKNGDIRVTRDVPPPWDGQLVKTPTGTTFPLSTAIGSAAFDNRLSDDSSNFGNFVRGNYDATGAFVGARPANNLGIVTASGSMNMTTSAAGVFYLIPLADGNTGFRQTLPSHLLDDYTNNWFYNLNRFRPILPQTDRLNLTATIRHKVGERTELFGELLEYRSHSITGRQPTSFNASADHNIYVGVDNPFNPFGSRFYHVSGQPNADGTPRLTGAPAAVQIASSTGVIPRDFKPRRIVVDGEAFRTVWGLRGKIWKDWAWESGVLYGRNTTKDKEHDAIRESRLRAALTSSNPAAAFNPFGYTFKLVPQTTPANPFLLQIDRPYTNPAALTDSLSDTFVREGRTEMASWDAKINGAVFENFWGGPIGAAVGTEWRWENYKDWRPEYAGLNPAGAPYNGNPNDPTNLFFGPTENDYIALSPNLNLYSARTIASVFSELNVPLVGKRNRFAGVRALDITIAGRAERFSDFGTTTKPKFGLSYRPTEWLMTRATVNSSFRAPNLVQINTAPLQRAVTGIDDPYRAEVTGLNVDSNGNRTVFRQGSGNLKPESARSLTAGLVVSLPFYRDFTVTVDYWRIKQRDVIDDVTADEQLLRDELLLDAAVQRALASGTPIAQLNLGSGSANYQGNPQVRRSAITPDDTARYSTYNTGRPASQQRAPVGSIISIVTDYVNLAGREVQGMDVGFEWKLPKNRLGQINIRGDASYLLQFDTIAAPGEGKVNAINRDGRTRFRGNIGGTYRTGPWTAGWFTTYFGPFVDTGASTTLEVYDALGRPDYISTYVDAGGVRRYRYLVSSAVNHNMYLNYTFPRTRERRLPSNLALRLGVNNVFDRDPPLADEDYGYRRGAATNPRGRAFYGQVTKRF
jgi:outer membrane receptor protein involved in Fe transport